MLPGASTRGIYTSYAGALPQILQTIRDMKMFSDHVKWSDMVEDEPYEEGSCLEVLNHTAGSQVKPKRNFDKLLYRWAGLSCTGKGDV